jgi:hypothetical protein
LTVAQKYDLLQGTLAVICFYILTQLQPDAIYDFIKGQSVIKLYVIFNSMEVFDRLCCSFGQIMFDSLFLVLMSRNDIEKLSAIPLSFETSKEKKSKANKPIKERDTIATKNCEGDEDKEETLWKGHATQTETLSFSQSPVNARTQQIKRSDSHLPPTSTLFRIGYFAVALIYVLVHSVLIFIKVIALNVAVNSKSYALITLLISTNFMEIKGSVFKSYKEETLFQTTCSDILERFQLLAYVFLISVNNFRMEFWSFDINVLPSILYVLMIIWGTEHLVDWTKHAFVIKFNRISPNVYSKYRYILASDVSDTRKEGYLLSIQNVCRRLGFVPLPFCCLALRIFVPVFQQQVISASFQTLIFFLLLCVTKMFVRQQLLKHCRRDIHKILTVRCLKFFLCTNENERASFFILQVLEENPGLASLTPFQKAEK